MEVASRYLGTYGIVKKDDVEIPVRLDEFLKVWDEINPIIKHNEPILLHTSNLPDDVKIEVYSNEEVHLLQGDKRFTFDYYEWNRVSLKLIMLKIKKNRNDPEGFDIFIKDIEEKVLDLF